MNHTQYKLWLKDLHALNVTQLNDVLTRIKLLDKIVTKEHVGKQAFDDRVLQVICSVLRKHNVETPSVTTLRKSAAYVSSKAKLEDLSTFFESISQSKLIQDSILKIAIDLLYVDLLGWVNIPISSHTILKQIHRIPATLNRHFPGYANSGVLTKLVKGA